jgi:hypothetical protein
MDTQKEKKVPKTQEQQETLRKEKKSPQQQ